MAGSNRRVAFLFREAGDFPKEKIGGKAASLVTMAQLGLPVPPWFTLSTGFWRAYNEYSRFPKRSVGQVERCIEALERATGKRFGGSENPLLVSVRSGAPASMPGMMDTILNIGVTKYWIPAMQKIGQEKFGKDTRHRFRSGFKKITGSDPPDDPWEQFWLALEGVCISWFNDRAVEFRKLHGISDGAGTAITVQAMVFGNLDQQSGTGVVFSRNVATGQNELYGEFLPMAQGEDVVGGRATPLPIASLADRHPQVFADLARYAKALEKHENDVVEIEFTIESGNLWVLQYRVAKRTPVASVHFAVQAVWEKRLRKESAVKIVSDGEVFQLRRLEFDPRAIDEVEQAGNVLAKGLPASPGAAVGVAVFSSEDAQRIVKGGERVVLIRSETTVDDFAGMLCADAIVTKKGGITSHAAVVARGLGKPAVVGAEELAIGFLRDTHAVRVISPVPAVHEGEVVSVDGTSGLVVSGRMPLTPRVHGKEVSIFLKWWNAFRPVGKIDFSATERKYSANTILNDVYLTDAMVKTAEGTELEKEALALRFRLFREAAEVLACYLVVAIAGELRHGWIHSWQSKDFEELENRFGLPREADAHDKRSWAQMQVVERLRKSSRKELLRFLDLAVPAFKTWTTGSVGGKRWADIAEAVHDYLSGKLNDATFVDRVFDLRHNGNRLFDKHPMFDLMTMDNTLFLQLACRQAEKNVDGLEAGLARLSSRDMMSPEVEALWEKGKGRLWAKTKAAAKIGPKVRLAETHESINLYNVLKNQG